MAALWAVLLRGRTVKDHQKLNHDVRFQFRRITRSFRVYVLVYGLYIFFQLHFFHRPVLMISLSFVPSILCLLVFGKIPPSMLGFVCHLLVLIFNVKTKNRVRDHFGL